MKTIPTSAAVADHLERLARRIAPTVALIIALTITTYNAGYRLGRMIHNASDWLAANWPTRPRTGTPEPLADVIAATDTVVSVQQITSADVLALRAQGLSQRAIAAQLGISRATVRRRLAMV